MSNNVYGLFGLSRKVSYIAVIATILFLLWVILIQWYIINERSVFIEKLLHYINKEASSIQPKQPDDDTNVQFNTRYESR